MMEEWIKKDSVIKAVCSGCLEENNTCRHGWDCPILTNLGRLPFIDRPQGEWRKRFGSINCSACGKSHWSACFEDLVRSFNYCPNCGAQMKGVDDE